MDYFLHILIMINIYVILSSSTNLLVGMTNLVSLGQAAFYGMGAYFAALCLLLLDLSLLPTLLLSMLFTSIFGLLIALPSLRLKDDYFILATLGFQMIVYTVLYNWIPVTRGPYGIAGIPAPRLIGSQQISGIGGYTLLSTILAVLIVFILHLLIGSPFGRVLKGIRDDQMPVLSLGRNVARFKTQAVTISCGFVGVAGVLYATYVSFIDPSSFALDESIFILSALLIGGTGNIKGPVLGAVFIVVLPELLRFLGLPDSMAANLRQIIYGLILIAIMRFRPKGLAGAYQVK